MKKHKTFLLFIIFISIIFVKLKSASAQVSNESRIKGEVFDTRDQPIVGAKIILKNLDNGQIIKVESKKDGSFLASYLVPGKYSLEINKEGYARMTDEFQLQAGRMQIIKAVMMTEREAADVKNEREAMEWYKKGIELVKENRLEEALGAFQNAINLKPDFPQAHTKIAEILAQGSEKEAFSSFEEGRNFIKENKLEEAIEAYQKAVKLKPDFAEAYLNLGILYYHLKKSDEAVKALLKAHELDQGETKTKQLLAEIYYEQAREFIQSNKINEAFEKLNEAYSLNSDHAYINYLLGILYTQKEKKDEAIRHLEIFLKIEPNSPQSENARAILKKLKQK